MSGGENSVTGKNSVNVCQMFTSSFHVISVGKQNSHN